jgi:putative nucleotidyltransferase with HDIG domain
MSTDLPRASSNADPLQGPRAELAKVIPRRKRVTWWIGLVLAAGFALALLPAITAERWLAPTLHAGQPAPYTLRIPQFAGLHTSAGHIAGGGILIARGEPVTDEAVVIDRALPQGPTRVVAFLLLLCVLGGLFSHHMQRSNHGRRLRTQLVNLALIAIAAFVVKAVMLTTAVSVLVVPVALLAMVPTLALDRVVGLATGTLTALVVALLVPFDVGVAVVLLVQVAVSGLVIAERPKHVVRAALIAGAVTTVCSALVYPLLTYLTSGALPFAELDHPLRSPWLACTTGPVLATALAVLAMPVYQLLVGEITRGKLVELEDLSNPLLRQIAEKSPGTWQHSLMMANMAEIAANAIGANGRLVRVGAYYHDLGKSLQPKYFIENLEPGETSPHDKLPPDVSCDAIFAHVTEGIVSARKAGLHERIIDFMHMHHGNGVLEYFWGKCQEQGNPAQLSVEHFRYPGVPPQSRETAILAICDAVEAASRTLKKPDTKSIDALVQRIVYGKLHLGQLDESGLSMGDLRRVADSLRETIKHANHNRIEYPWQKASQDASATPEIVVQTGPRLDSLDRPAKPDVVRAPSTAATSEALADTANNTPDIRKRPSELDIKRVEPTPLPPAESQPAMPAVSASAETQPAMRVARNSDELALMTTAPIERPSDSSVTAPRRKQTEDDEIGALAEPPVPPAMIEEDTGRRRKPENAPETAAFVAEAKNALAEASKDLAAKADELAIPRETSDPEISIKQEAPEPTRSSPTSGARKRAATLPPTAAMLRRPPTVPPPTGVLGALFATNATAPTAPGLNSTLPPPASLRAPALVIEESLDGTMTIEPAKVMSDAAITQPRMERMSEPDFGTDTPTRAPTRAELQALRDSPPDPTRKQTVEEIEALHLKSLDRSSEPELHFERRAHPTTEVNDEDIEAAIELAPAARKTSVGVAKKKPE